MSPPVRCCSRQAGRRRSGDWCSGRTRSRCFSEEDAVTPADVIREATTRSLSNERGKPITLQLRPGMSDAEIEEFARHLPCALPPEIHELLRYGTGFDRSPLHILDFTGRDCLFEYADAFPYGLPIAGDGCGNFWVVDLLPESTQWGPIYFACHDAPVILYQSPTLEQFLVDV